MSNSNSDSDSIYNELEEYMINESKKRSMSINFIKLSTNSMISINALIQICINCGKDYTDYILYNPHLTIDDIEKYYKSRFNIYAPPVIGKYYDIFSDNRIEFHNNIFYYKTLRIAPHWIMFNKYLSYDLYKSKYENIISNNDYIGNNPNGNFINYDMSDISKLVNHINYFEGIYNERLEEIIIEYNSILKNKIYEALRYLRYEFILENIDLFSSYGIFGCSYLYKNESLTIDNVVSIINNNESVDEYIIYIFIHSNITLEEIIANNLHTNAYFYHFAENRNCTVSDILNNPDLNFKDIDNYLSSNKHDYKYNTYEFKFAD